MTSQVWDATTLPQADNVNPYAYCMELVGSRVFTRKGSMIAYYGNVQFQPLMVGGLASWAAARFSSPLYASDYVVAEGLGKVLLAHRGFDVNSYELEDANLTVRCANLLAFEQGLALKESIVPGFVTLLGTGRMIAASNGPVMFREPPIRVDPQALVGWADCPSPSVHYDVSWMSTMLTTVQSFFGTRSGEESQYDFTGAGTVLLQSSEAVLDDAAMVRQLNAQIDGLPTSAVPGVMQRLQGRMGQTR